MSPDGMKDDPRESLSAFVDGELAADQTRFLLSRMQHDIELYATWNRYHIIRDGMRQHTVPLASVGFANSVHALIESAPGVSARRRWLQWSGGGVIAAGVAAMALMAVQPGNDAPASHTQSVEPIAAISQPVSQPHAAPAIPRWLSNTPTAAQMAEPAAATFYSPITHAGIMHAGIMDAGRMAPYMTIPVYPVTARRSASARSTGYPLLAVPQSSGLPIHARAQ